MNRECGRGGSRSAQGRIQTCFKFAASLYTASTDVRSGQVSPSRAASAARTCSERKGSCWKSDSSHRSSASASTVSAASARPSRASSRPASSPRNASSRLGSPGGWVAAIGRPAGSRTGARRASRRARARPRRCGRRQSDRADASAISAGASRRVLAGPERRAEPSTRCNGPARGRSLRHERARLGPVACQLPVRDRAHPQARGELELRRDRDADEGRHGGVRTPLAEERALQLGVGTVERRVIPVEPTTRLGGRDEQAEQDGAEQRLLFERGANRRALARDARRRLAPQLLQGDQRVVAARRRRRAPRRTAARAAGTRRATGRGRGRAPRTRPGSSPPSSSSRNRNANAPSVNARSTCWR